MGELSQRIGKKLEHYGNSIFEHLEWKILAQDVQIDCIRAAHKNAKSSDKKTHGVDILAGYYNPFTKRQEAFIIECKHREWSNFIPSNLSLWVEELCNTMTQMQEVMNFEQNNLKSTVVIISPKSEQSKEDFLTSIADEFVNKGRSSNTKYTLKNIARNQTSVTLQYIYKKPQKGRIKIAETRTVTLDVTISPLEDDSQKYKVSIRHEGMSESKQFVTLLDEMIQEDSEQAVFGLKRITLASLLKAHKVDSFDDFGVYTHKEWKLTDIINVTVNKDEKSIDDENDVTTSGEIDASEPSGRLSGISSAILKGDGLRNNDFVKECMSQGFIFSSMSYKFSHKTLPITIVIDVNFKQTDLKINIVKTYQLEDDGIERLAPLPSSDQSLYIDYFQNVAYAVYSNLIEKQKDELVKQTIKPEK